MGLLKVADFREQYSIDSGEKGIKDAQIAPSLNAASRLLRRWVGELYDTNDAEVKAELAFAENCLAMHFAITALNTDITVNGVVKSMKVDGNTVRSFLTPAETAQLKQAYFEQAEQVVRGLIPEAAPVTEFGVFNS